VQRRPEPRSGSAQDQRNKPTACEPLTGRRSTALIHRWSGWRETLTLMSWVTHYHPSPPVLAGVRLSVNHGPSLTVRDLWYSHMSRSLHTQPHSQGGANQDQLVISTTRTRISGPPGVRPPERAWRSPMKGTDLQCPKLLSWASPSSPTAHTTRSPSSWSSQQTCRHSFKSPGHCNQPFSTRRPLAIPRR
jgi:hypothetical protein